MTDKIEEAIENRDWESLDIEELQQAEKKLREKKNEEYKQRSFDYAIVVDKWIGVNKAITKREGVEV